MTESIFAGRGIPPKLFEGISDDCYDMLTDNEFMTSLRQLSLDLVVVDVFPLNKCLILLPHVLDLPFIYVAPTLEPSWKMRIQSMPSVIPLINPHGTPHTEQMSFTERTTNFIMQIVIHCWFFPEFINYGMIAEFRRSDKIRDYDDIALDAQMFFYDRDYLLEYPNTMFPNVVTLGGITARDANPLSPDWAEWANSATDGFIVVSFGSGVDGFPTDVIRKLSEAFIMMKCHVVWRIGNITNLIDLPERIKVGGGWSSISSILANHQMGINL